MNDMDMDNKDDMDKGSRGLTISQMREEGLRLDGEDIYCGDVLIAIGAVDNYELDTSAFRKGTQRKPVESMVDDLFKEVAAAELKKENAPKERYILYPGISKGRMITPEELIKQHGLDKDVDDIVVFSIMKPNGGFKRKKIRPI